MAIQTIDGFEIKAPVSIDNRYGPFSDTTDANTKIESFYRYIGLTVLITGSGTQIEYWYNPTIADEDLVPKGAALTITGSDGQVVFFSGSDAISGSPYFAFDYTASTPIFNVSGAISASYGPNTVGFYGTASWALNALTASFVTASNIWGPFGSGSILSASYASSSTSASYSNTSSFSFTSSLAYTASFVTASNVYGPFGSNSVISASYAAHGGDVTQIIAGTNITIAPPEGTGSVTINASATAGSGLAVTATASFTNLSVWNFTHNLQSRYVVIQALDLNHQQIIPEVIELLDTMSARLTFPTFESGYAIASIGGITASYALTASSVVTNTGGTIYSSGTDLIIDPVGNLIISGNMIPGPPYTDNTSSYNLGSPTAAWNHLYVANGSVVFITGSNTADLKYTGTHIAATKPFSGSFTGSFYGTSSWAQSASQALTASYYIETDPIFVNKSASLATTGSNIFIGNQTITGSLNISGSIALNNSTASITGVDYIDFDNQYIIGTNEPAWKEGRLFYDSGSGGLAFYNWEQDVTLNIGQEQWLRARNATGVTITNGTVVRLLGAVGDRPTVEPAQSTDQTNTFSTGNEIIGMATHDIENGTDGFITTFGLVNGLNTQAFTVGDLLWVSQSAGQFTNVPPSPPYDRTFVGIVTRKNPNNGTVFMTPLTPIHFHDISSVSASAYQQGDLWMYRSGSTGQANAWINTKQLSGSYGITGSLTMQGNIIPGGPYVNNTSSYNLGSPTAAWDKIYVSNNSLHFVSGSTSSSIGFNNGIISFNNATIAFPSGSTSPTASLALRASGSLTGSLLGTSSWATNALTSSTTTAFDGAWTSYTPSWTAASSNPSIGNGSLQGWYKVVGKTCFVRGNIVIGSTTTLGSGEWYVSMPFTASHADAILMTANLLDNGTAWYNATVNGARAGFNHKAPLQYQGGAGTALDVNATQPFAWTNSDRFLWNGSYETA